VITSRLAERLTGVAAIVVRELRGRMRGRKAFVFLTVYLVVLGGLIYVSVQSFGGQQLMNAIELSNEGRGIFMAVVLVETLIVAALAPAYTAGAISQEREKQTYDLLVVTPIASTSIALGKLVSGLAYLLLLVLASVPLAALGFLFGGIDPASFLPPYIVLVVGAFALGSIGLFFSALFKRTQPASIATYLLLVVAVAGTLLAGDLWYRITDDPGARPPEAIYYLNPYFAQADVFCDMTGDPSLCLSVPGARDVEVAPGIGGAFGGLGQVQGTGSGFWVRSVLAWLGIAAVMLVAASRFISPTHSWRPGDLFRRAPHPPPSEAEA
jgi:ABC-2 type transport system permease protein